MYHPKNTNGQRRKALDIVYQVYVAENNSPLIRSPPIGLLKVLVNLVSEDPENRLKALETICSISVSTVYRKVLAMSSVGLVEVLVDIIKTDNGQLRLEAFVIIGNLLSYQENLKKLSSPSLGLVEVLMKWKKTYDDNINNWEDIAHDNEFAPPALYIQKMIQALEANAYNSEFPSLVQPLSPSLNYRS